MSDAIAFDASRDGVMRSFAARGRKQVASSGGSGAPLADRQPILDSSLYSFLETLYRPSPDTLEHLQNLYAQRTSMSSNKAR